RQHHQVRLVFHSRDCLSSHSRGRLFLLRRAVQPAPGAHTLCRAPGVEHARMPRVPEHHSQGGASMLVLHRGGRTSGGVAPQTACRTSTPLTSVSCHPTRCLGSSPSARTSSSSSSSVPIRTSMLATPRRRPCISGSRTARVGC